MRSPNHYYYTRGSSYFLVFRLASSSPSFCSSALFSSLGRTEGLFPRLKTPIKLSEAHCKLQTAFLIGIRENYGFVLVLTINAEDTAIKATVNKIMTTIRYSCVTETC